MTGADRFNKKALLANSAWLFVAQIVSIVSPLLSFPILTRAFGPYEFGIFNFVTASSAFAVLIVDFGFQLTSARALAQASGDSVRQSEILTATIVAKLLLLVPCWLVFIVSLRLGRASGITSVWPTFVFISTILISFTPAWALTAMNWARGSALVIGLPKIGSALFALAFVRGPQDLLSYSIAMVIMSSVGALVALIILHGVGVRLSKPNKTRTIASMRESAAVFISMAAANLYTTSNIIVVTAILGPAEGGLFAAADRIRNAVTAITSPIAQALYPALCRLAAEGGHPSEHRLRQVALQSLVIVSALGCFGIFITAKWLMLILAGKNFMGSVLILQILAPVPLLISISNALGIQTMLPMRLEKSFSASLQVGAVIGVGSMIIFSEAFGLRGSALAVNFAELAVVLMMAFFLKRKFPKFSLLSLGVKP